MLKHTPANKSSLQLIKMPAGLNVSYRGDHEPSALLVVEAISTHVQSLPGHSLELSVKSSCPCMK